MDIIFLRLAKKWERDAESLEYSDSDSSQEALLDNSKMIGKRETLKECAEKLRKLVEILGKA